MKLQHDPKKTEDALVHALEALATQYPLSTQEGTPLEFTPLEAQQRTLRVRREGNTIQIGYSDLTAALRGVGLALSGLDTEGEVRSPFKTVGIMLDCSRNAVMRVGHFKQWLRQLALLGYNMAMLYTEDTYELPGEAGFGYMRGAYTADELHEIDAYAAGLGIEMVACIQTLGHMAQVLKWPSYTPVRDTPDILLAEEEQTYSLIDKALAHWAKVYGTRRIHIGMDEAHDLGRGQYLDKHGHHNGFEIFNRHLDRVVALCEKHGLDPMIWSDMYFRLGSKSGDYYDPATVIPPEVAKEINPKTQLVYWDYYHDNADFYRDWIERHRALGFEPVMASGVWTWGCPWYAANYTESFAGPCIDACAEKGLGEIIFTLWGDDGALCDFDSCFAGLAWAAEKCYGQPPAADRLATLYTGLFGGDYKAVRSAGQMSFLDRDGVEVTSLPIAASPTLWDDPLLGIYWNNRSAASAEIWRRALQHWEGIARDLAPHAAKAETADTGGDLHHAWLLASTLAKKTAVRAALLESYPSRDDEGLRTVQEAARETIGLLKKLDVSITQQWLRRNKPHGLEVLQVRLAGQVRRHEELVARLDMLLQGEITALEELERLPDEPPLAHGHYRMIATACAPGI